MHRSTLVLIAFSLFFAGCASLCGRACGNGAYNRTLAEETSQWRYGGDVAELRQAAIDGLMASRGHSVPEDCFDADDVCRFDVLGNVWEFRISDGRRGLRLSITEQIGESSPTDEPRVIVEAISILEPEEGQRIKTLATQNGERARRNATARCNRCWESASVEAE